MMGSVFILQTCVTANLQSNHAHVIFDCDLCAERSRNSLHPRMMSVDASVGPLAIDLVVFAFTIGPLTLSLNVLTLVGIAIIAFIVRSWI